MAARELAERRGVAWLGQGELGSNEQLTGFQRSGVEALEKVFCGDAPLAFFSGDDEGRAEGERAGGQLGRRIAESAAPPEGAAVADRRVRDVRHRGRDERQMPGDLGGALELGVAGGGGRGRPRVFGPVCPPPRGAGGVGGGPWGPAGGN